MNLSVLKPQYTTQNIITNVDTAIEIIKQSSVQVPCPANLKCNIERWQSIIDIISVNTITALGRTSELPYSLTNVFKTLSIKLDESSPYEIQDILNIKVSSNVNDVKESESHVTTVFNYCISQLPPVTAGLIGGFLSEIRVFETTEYLDEILPMSKKYGGLHNPYTKSIDITEQKFCSIYSNTDEHPCTESKFSCIILHEIGHTVHTIYGFLRPGGHGYEYPSEKFELDSTGCVERLDLTKVQSKFVYDTFRAYTYNQMECYENIRYDNYGTAHPAEAFACAFEKLVRTGENNMMNNYKHFYDVFTHIS